MPNVNPTYIAGGTISPCRFVTMVPRIFSGTTTPTPADFTIWQATDGTANGGDRVFGVSQEGTDLWSSANAATVDEEVRIFGPGEVALVECGGNVTSGAAVKSDINGKAIAASVAADFVGGYALQSGISGTKIQILVHPYRM